MKYSIVFIYAAALATFRQASGLVKNTSGGQVLSSGGENNENVCEIQKMAQDMIEKKLNEKDLFTDIMDTLQNRLTDTSLCVNDSVSGICIVEKDQKPLSFQCTSEKYEQLIDKFTNKKLCHSKIAFNNTLLSAFIDKNDSKNAFTGILNNLDIASQCIDEELKEIYVSTVELFKELRGSVTTLSEKLWSNKMIEVLKKREEIIAGIFCELRNGSESKIIQNGMTIENVGIIKINDTAFLNEAVQAFSEYYAYFPYFARDLLVKGGLVDRLIEIHEKLTTYRAKHLVSRLNEKSKDEVIDNENMLNQLKNYKHFGSSNGYKNNNGGFVEINEHEESSEQINEDNADSHNTKEDIKRLENIVKGNSNKGNVPTPTNQDKNSKVTEKPVKSNDETGTEINNPLFAMDETKSRNVKEYIKELLVDLDIIKFENGEPTVYLNDEGVKKEVEDSFISLESSTMLVRLFVKLQAVVLSVVQSFIIMTPSPTKDVKTYCKKAIMNGTLVDHPLGTNENEEEELVHTFANKYNLLYEKIKLNELKKIEELSRRNVGKKNKLSALQVNIRNSNTAPVIALVENTDNSDANQKAPVIAVVSDPNGKSSEDIVKENVNLSALSKPVDDTYKQPNRSLYTTLSSLFIVCIFLVSHI